MILFKGRSYRKQYNPMKPIKIGYKVWCLADSKSGYVLTFAIYTGKSNSSPSPGDTLGEWIVINLSVHLRNTGVLVTFDNFFMSINLMNELRTRKIYAVGAVRNNRKGLSGALKEKTKMNRGEYTYKTKGCVAANKRINSMPVFMLTNVNNPAAVTSVNRKNKDGTKSTVPCPAAISHYNTRIGAVHRFDQFRERYAIGRFTLKKYSE
ncbi:piggyBac transposable element-derived protein 4-like [Belonocnema kinseyi]|uniref:piggyBac transposable element-derived protein 4-like n=1 Tax=Belonocnema kinseyi TaxID=2817044 RepID=UPI00143DB074|nr:piggyBac transposable element-derived protein 4-like [Belonocnema kinseyi]